MKPNIKYFMKIIFVFIQDSENDRRLKVLFEYSYYLRGSIGENHFNSRSTVCVKPIEYTFFTLQSCLTKK